MKMLPTKTVKEADEEAPVNAATRQQIMQMNSLFNGHLMKWKSDAEEGTAFLRVPAFFGALGLIGTSIQVLVTVPEARTSPDSIVMSIAVFLMSFFVIILDGRFLAFNPLGFRANMRNVLTRNFNLLRFLWGRGLLYISAGGISVAQLHLPTIISGSFMIVIGVLSLIVGLRASRTFATLRNSLTDESFLLLAVNDHDADGDGFLTPYEFARLVQHLGMELDDKYAIKAFSGIDTDHDHLISIYEFCYWWSTGYGYAPKTHGKIDANTSTYTRMF